MARLLRADTLLAQSFLRPDAGLANATKLAAKCMAWLQSCKVPEFSWLLGAT